jgi:glycosyltransferase involved in cell wall biosynthesis
VTGWFWAGLVTGLAANELLDISEWAARRLVRWSARLRYEDPERAGIRAEELDAVITARPGQLLKLITAGCFFLSATRVWMGRVADRLASGNGARSRVRDGIPVSALGGRVLVIVQNLPVPYDRRTWLECQALASAGYDVTVICPKDPGAPSHEVIDGVELYKYRPYAPNGATISFAAEYVHSFIATARLAAKARRSGPFSVIQACNPPDIFWPIAMVFRAVDRTRFVYDHHDLVPELYESRFPGGPRLPYKALQALERITHRTADHVIAVNNSYRSIAFTRGGKLPGDVTVVRTGPDPQRLRRGQADPALKRGHKYLAAYIGVMGPQDGVDFVVRAADILVRQFGRDDIAFTLIGNGDCFDELVALRDALGLAGHVEFTGRVPDDLVKRILSTADVGLSPDPKNPINDLSTFNKVAEYMAFELPVIAFDLHETRATTGDAAVYVTPNNLYEYAATIMQLVDDREKRSTMGKAGRSRVERELAWDHQKLIYLDSYRRYARPRKAT